MNEKGIKYYLNESSLAKRIILNLSKVALKNIPIIGPIFEGLDEGLLLSIEKDEQNKLNKLIMQMYERFEPLVRKLEKENLPDEQFFAKLNEPEISEKLKQFSDEIEKNKDKFEDLVLSLNDKVKELGNKIKKISECVEEYAKGHDNTAHFKYIGESIKQRIKKFGSIDDLYDDLKKIGRFGGQGIIYRAYRKNFSHKKAVIVKILKAKKTKDSKAVQRFLLEGFLASQVINSNIVKVIDYGGYSENEQYYIEMEDLGDINLKKWCELNPFKNNNDIEKYISVIIQGINALEYLHSQNLVHRDIKPSNFMLVNGKNILIDFGCVKSLEQKENLDKKITMTATGDVIGTPQYMSPEQFDSSFAKISSATDIYCFGVTLFEMFTGKLPFIANTMYEYGVAHTKTESPRLQDYNEEIPLWLDNLVYSMLKKDPRERIKLTEIKVIIENNRPENIEKAIQRVKSYY